MCDPSGADQIPSSAGAVTMVGELSLSLPVSALRCGHIHVCPQGHFSLDKDSTVTALTGQKTRLHGRTCGGKAFQQLKNRVCLQLFDPGIQSQLLPRKSFWQSMGKTSDYCLLLQRWPPLSAAHISAPIQTKSRSKLVH